MYMDVIKEEPQHRMVEDRGMLRAVGNTLKMVISALCAWLVLVIAMFVVSGGEPAAHDWYIVLAIGAAASIGLIFGSWRHKSRT
jgi:hypothetical protein